MQTIIPLPKLLIDSLLVIILAGLIGYERQVKRGIYSVGIRTHMLLCFASFIITLMSIHLFPNDPARIISTMISAIGFIAAGTIISSRQEVFGLTTGIGLLIVTALGILIANSLYIEAVITTTVSWIILELWRFEIKAGLKKK